MVDLLPASLIFRTAAIGLLLAVSCPVQAQTDQRALDALGPAQGTPEGTPEGTRAGAPHHHAAQHAHAVHHPAPATPSQTLAAGPLPTIPAKPPPPPAIKAPVIDVPLHPEPPPPPVPVVATAAGAASAIQGGSRITFGSDSADLNPATMQALKDFAAGLKADPEARAQVDAYCRGTSDDPSTPRRMSLSRGLAARAVLINGGIASTRIYVRAVGQPGDGGPADRVDLIRSDEVQTAPDARNPPIPPATTGAPATP